MNWLSTVPWLVAYAFGLLVMVAVLAWVAYVMAEVARAARRQDVWGTARVGWALGHDLARRLPRGHDWPRRLVARFPGVRVTHTTSTARQPVPLKRGSSVLYVGPGDWTYVSAWVIDTHPDGALDLEWVHPFLGTPVRALAVRPERDKTEGMAYWRPHPASTPILAPSLPRRRSGGQRRTPVVRSPSPTRKRAREERADRTPRVAGQHRSLAAASPRT